MGKRDTPEPDPASIERTADDQHARFVELARELGCDDDEAAFERAVRNVARAGRGPSREHQEPVAPEPKKD